MSELLDKPEDVKKREFENKIPGVYSHKLPQAHEKLCNDNEANLSAVLRVNNSLSGRIAVLLLGLVTHYRES